MTVQVEKSSFCATAQLEKETGCRRDNILVIRCIDFRHQSLFSGTFEVSVAGPRFSDAKRSIEVFLHAKASEPGSLAIVWTHHTEVCACGKLELHANGVTNPRATTIDDYSDKCATNELSKLCLYPCITAAIESSKLKIWKSTVGFPANSHPSVTNITPVASG